MMDQLKHECGIAMIRLRKPLAYYEKKYGTHRYALEKLYLMMEKQHNRGQEGAGLACVKLDQKPGHEYMYREKAEGKDAITKVFQSVYHQISHPAEDEPEAPVPYIGEMYMGHLRYSTTGKGGLKYVHPFLRRNNWKAKNLCLCGNFNMTNISEVFDFLTSQGQYPRIYSDSYILLELMGHRLDREVERLFAEAQQMGLEGLDITRFIDLHVQIANVLRTTMPHFDGGYVMCGLTGSGEFFAMRDPAGIRPAFYYVDDEVVAVASERPVLQTTFAVDASDICELAPGRALGQYPRIYSDSYILLELMGHRLDREVERLFAEAQQMGLEGLDITRFIDLHVQIANVLRTTMPHFDGGYVMCGLTGSGEFFAMRDPAGIRPAFYYVDDEVVAVASERPVLQTTFAVDASDICELAPGRALMVNAAGDLNFEQIIEPAKYQACSFERIYFSRGNDFDIHRERKLLGFQLRDAILKSIDGDIEHSVFSYIPNTAEVAYHGMMDGIRQHCVDIGKPLSLVRSEKVVWKDIKLRTFITEGTSRNNLAAHVYDITFGTVQPGVDNLVVIDDSIVRGTTLRESIIQILDRLHPRKIVIVSSAPQIRYPDFYGIDMSRIGEFIAFQAAVALIEERGMHSLLDEVYEECKGNESGNPVRRIYEPFTADELNLKMVELLQPATVQTPIELVFQSLEGLHEAIPNHPGDWYFSGKYPTPGGERLCRISYTQWYEARKN